MAQTKTVHGVELPASAFLYVPDKADPSTWKLPVKDANGEPNLGRVAAAAAALSPKGFRGQPVDIPADERGAVKRKLVALYKRLGRAKTEIPAHLLESKSAEDDATTPPCPDDTDACPLTGTSLEGRIQSIKEVEYKGTRGLAIDAVMNSLGRDSFGDWALLTAELKASTEKYFSDYPVAMVQHGKPYRSLDGAAVLAPVRHIMGFTLDHAYEDDGIHIHDFVPEPDAAAPDRLQAAYLEIKNGEFDGVSVGGFFYRDTGLHQPPGLIIDWDLLEHSYCRHCVDADATIASVTELKAQSDAEAATIWQTMSEATIPLELAAAYQELKARVETPAEAAPADETIPQTATEAQTGTEADTGTGFATVTPETPAPEPSGAATPPLPSADESLYGGAAGGDKSSALLAEALATRPPEPPAAPTDSPAESHTPPAEAKATDLAAEPGALSGMDLYRTNHALPRLEPRQSGGATPPPAGGHITVQGLSVSPARPASGLPAAPARAAPSVTTGRIQSDPSLATGVSNPVPVPVPVPIPSVSPLIPKQPVSSAPTPEHKSNPNPIPTSKEAVDPSPAISGGNMNDNVQPSGQSATESNDLLQQLLSRVESMEAEKKALELEALNKQRDEEARKTAEDRARQVAEQAAQAEAEQKAKTEKYFNEALARYQIKPVGAQFALPLNAGSHGSGSGNRPRFTMAGPVQEEKARTDGHGNEMPINMIDWIFEVKSGQRKAQWLSWTDKFGPEAKAVTMGVPGAQTNSPAGSAGGFALPVQYLEEIVPLLIDQFSIRSLISTYPANAILLEVPRMASQAVRAVVTAEGDTKPKRQFGTDMLSIRLYTIPQIVDVTNQLLNFSRETAEQIVREQMADAIRLAEFYYALQGSGTNEPFGLLPALTAAQAATPGAFYLISQAAGNQPTGAAVPNTETIPDVIARAINVTQLRYYEPDALLVHPNIWWKLITTKDNYGRYLVDANMTGQVNSVWGIRVVHTTQLPMGKAVVGSWKKLRMYIAQDVTVDVTQEAGDRWDKNLTGFRIEEMIGLDARQELNAFTGIDFTSAGVASS
jgi:HK97 family phage major capsid protein